MPGNGEEATGNWNRQQESNSVRAERLDETSGNGNPQGGRTAGFCKLIADRESRAILGCQVLGERVIEIVQVVAIAIAAGMRVDDLARVPLSFPTYAGIFVRAAYRAAQQLHLEVSWQTHNVEVQATSNQ